VPENRLKSVSDGGTFAYDPTGQRTKKVENGITTYYFFGCYEEEWQNDAVIKATKYYFANGMRIAERSDTDELRYYHADHLGSSTAITNADGSQVLLSTGYTPYGSSAYSTGSATIKYQYTGQEKDACGLMYYNARYYDPELGRFIQPDTMLDGLNRYTYCGGNPIMYSDPSGHFTDPVTFIIGVVALCIIVPILNVLYEALPQDIQDFFANIWGDGTSVSVSTNGSVTVNVRGNTFYYDPSQTSREAAYLDSMNQFYQGLSEYNRLINEYRDALVGKEKQRKYKNTDHYDKLNIAFYPGEDNDDEYEYCKELLDKINEVADELEKRYLDMLEDRYNLFEIAPDKLPGIGSWKGHQDKYVDVQDELSDLANDFFRSGCNLRLIPVDINALLKRPYPAHPARYEYPRTTYPTREYFKEPHPSFFVVGAAAIITFFMALGMN
jgi:RHS repeat-associated protein